MSQFIESLWFGGKHKWLAPVLWPLSKLYGSIAGKRRAEFISQREAAYRAPVPVVVVGNITAGGNGKTPVVIWLAEQLKSRGFNPGVVSRGYGAKAPSYPFVVTEETSASECGDEPLLIHRRTGVPVVVDPVRSNAVKKLLTFDVDIVITDDGLQHYKLDRDLEFVVIDGSRRFGNQQYIPLGPLREGIERLDSVDFRICNGGSAAEGEIPMALKPADAINLVTGEKRAVSKLDNVVAMAGIGHPDRFFNTLKSLKLNPVQTRGFADHQAFEPTELERLAEQGNHLIMTEKDAVKCYRYAKENWWYLPVDADIPEEDANRILTRIQEIKEQYGPSTA
ncbi:tetraacyldisaccharide 4'-kinase [Parasalinivibrio latis]|uniref:tetraacyldisaccharide 4'-kinase n=1 Tax=Parasalinivibrio latis TaxID=2952610 RepID=UPI0030DF6CB7